MSESLAKRIGELEAKIDFVLKTGSVTKREHSRVMPGEFISTQMSLLDLFNEIKSNGLTVINPSEQANG